VTIFGVFGGREMSEYTERVERVAIETHIEMLLKPELLAKIGADEGDNRPLHLRVMRICSKLNDCQHTEEINADLLAACREALNAIGCARESIPDGLYGLYEQLESQVALVEAAIAKAEEVGG
jgi:hypothetical protein